MEVSHTVAFSDITRCIPSLGARQCTMSPDQMKHLGVLYEDALNMMEAGEMREDEFQEVRTKLRNLGMQEMWY